MQYGNLRFALLSLIASRPNGVHGYRLTREVAALCEESFFVNHARVYRVLELLEQDGELEVHNEIQNGRPNRKLYRLTAQGRRTVERWLCEPAVDEPYPVRDETAMKLLVCDLHDLDRMADMVRHQRCAYLARLRRVGRRKLVLNKAGWNGEATEFAVEIAEARVRAELAWLERVESEEF